MFTADDKLQQRLTPHLQRVLIVDPQPAAVKLLGELLRSVTPGQIATAASDQKAIQLAQAVDPQIIFIEHSGPSLDGARLARAIRRSDLLCRKAPIIMVTGEATAQAILGARDAGVHEFLRKPFTIKDLLRRLEAVALKPRDWVEAVQYVGPDRRRFNSGEYAGPRKRKSDARKTPDQARVLQALKIVRAAAGALDSDWAQARRALLAQAQDLQKAAVAVGDMKLMTAAVDLGRQLSAEGPVNRADLDGAIAALVALMPRDEALAA
ncbi:MAG TPA: response regulator [Caulobacter sp.]|nr:response regulator [Caulobacter sp.]